MKQDHPAGALLTDLYQLTMNASYFDNEMTQEITTFEMFVRRLPEDWGYFIAAGVDEAIDHVLNLGFTDDDIDYLRGLNQFSEDYLEYLKGFRFSGDITAIREGTPFTANAPIIRVTAKRPEAQLVETMLLNIVNFQTMIASKASRIVNAAGEASVMDFGLRRAHGFDAGIKGARSAYIAGVTATSNVEAAKMYDIPASGTMAHSFVMGFESEIDSFRAFAHTFPASTVLLIDTYDTLEGAKKTAIVGKEMEEKGNRLLGVRLDSGDMEDLAYKVREILDSNGLEYVKIVLSSDLNEYKIDKYRRDGTPVDSYGVGTEMITAKPVSALSGVYKIVEDNMGPRIKLSESKQTYPGKKQVYRVEENGVYLYDTLELDGVSCTGSLLLVPVVENGVRVKNKDKLEAVRKYSLECVRKLPAETKKVKATPYRLKIGSNLTELTEKLIASLN
jgi:nicotinate phosphoribosyltransferase